MDFQVNARKCIVVVPASAYTSFRYSESMAPPIGARETEGLPKASVAELLVTKQDPNSCDRVKVPQIWRQCL